jgi:hypothetical protein
MVRQDLGGKRLMMDVGRVVALFGIDSRPDKVNALIPVVKMDRRKMIAAISQTCVVVHTDDLLDQFLLPGRCWTVW